MEITNTQIFYVIFLFIFVFIFVIKQESKNILKPNENKYFNKIRRSTIVSFLFIGLIFGLAIAQNKKTEKEYLEQTIEQTSTGQNDQ